METAVKIEKEGRNVYFDKCKIYGAVENKGQGVRFRKTFIGLK